MPQELASDPLVRLRRRFWYVLVNLLNPINGVFSAIEKNKAMSQHNQTSQEQKPLLNWTSSGWVASTDKLHIFVPQHVYQKALAAYFASKGMKRKTLFEIMAERDEEWKKQCEVENEFRANLDQWFVSTEFGVFVRRK